MPIGLFERLLTLPYVTKSFPFEVKEVNLEEGTFEGYASVFGNIDAYDEIIDKGAFTKTIQENLGRIKICWNHFWDEPIGKPLTLEEDNHGLFTKGKVSQTSRGKDILTLMRDNVVTEMSIGFETLKDEFQRSKDGQNIRHIKEIRLWEYSPVTWAANDLALITGVKNAFGTDPLDMKLGSMIDFTRYAKSLLELKEGRVLSENNLHLLKDAITALQALLTAAEPLSSQDDDDSTLGDKKAASDAENEKIKSILVELQETTKSLKR